MYHRLSAWPGPNFQGRTIYTEKMGPGGAFFHWKFWSGGPKFSGPKFRWQASLIFVLEILDSRLQSRACEREWICGQTSLTQRWVRKSISSFAGSRVVTFLKLAEKAKFCWTRVDSEVVQNIHTHGLEIVIQEHLTYIKIHLIVWNCTSCLETTSWYQNFIKWTGVLPRLLFSMGDPEKL